MTPPQRLVLQLLLCHNVTRESGSSPGKVLDGHLWNLCRRPSPPPPLSAECRARAESQWVPCHTPSPLLVAGRALVASSHIKLALQKDDPNDRLVTGVHLRGGGGLSGSPVTDRAGAHV